MPDLDEILRMFTKPTEDGDIPVGSFSEIARLGKNIFQSKLSGKAQIKTQIENKVPSAQEKIEADMANRKISTNKAIINSSAQNKADSVLKNSANGNEVFSYDFTADELVKGIIFSELLGQPKCRRKGKGYRSRRAR